MLEAVRRVDLRTMRYFANIQNPLAKDVMTGFSSLASPVNSIVFLAIMFYLSRPLFIEIVPVLVLSWTVVYGTKIAVSRERPDGNTETGMTPSFPSGHSATAFLFAVEIGASHPSIQPLMFSLAAVTSGSRLYLQTHYLSDVVVGSLIGLSLAVII